MMFKVGDRVKIKKDLIIGKRYGEWLFTIEMEKYKGVESEVLKESKNDRENEIYGYFLGLDNGNHCWTEEMMELVDDKKNNFIVRCLESYYDIMTKGKTYEFINGKFKHDNGTLSLIYSSFSDFVQRNPNYEVELIEETSNLLEQREKLEKELVDYKEIIEQQNKKIEVLKKKNEKLKKKLKKKNDIKVIYSDSNFSLKKIVPPKFKKPCSGTIENSNDISLGDYVISTIENSYFPKVPEVVYGITNEGLIVTESGIHRSEDVKKVRYFNG